VAYRDEPDIDLTGSDAEGRKTLRPYFWPLLFLALGLPSLKILKVSNGLSWAAFGFTALWFLAVWVKVRMADRPKNS
jgi:hypothetical protein